MYTSVKYNGNEMLALEAKCVGRIVAPLIAHKSAFRLALLNPDLDLLAVV